jgi:hypothetical protein
MHANRRAHIPVSFAETNHAAVAGAAQEEKVGAVRSRVVAGEHVFVAFGLAHRCNQRIPLGLLTLKCSPIFMKRSPDFNQGEKSIASDGVLGR